jgi:hypothetical protein
VNTKWWQDGPKARLQRKLNGLVTGADQSEQKRNWDEEQLGLGNRSTRISHWTGGGSDQKQAVIEGKPLDEAAKNLAIWSIGGFTISDQPPIWLKDALESPNWRKTARHVELAGSAMILVEGQRKRQPFPSFLAWLDPRHSYFAKRLVVFDYDGEFDERRPHMEIQVTSFHAPCKNTQLSFPAEILRRFVFEHEPRSPGVVSVERNSFHHVRINEPIAPEVFQIVIPAGYKVADYTTGRHYTMGAGGKELDSGPILPIPAPPSPEPSRGWIWMLIAGAALCLAGILAWRRRLQAS